MFFHFHWCFPPKTSWNRIVLLAFPHFCPGFLPSVPGFNQFPQFFPWILPGSAFPHGFSHVFSTVSPWISPGPLGHIEVLTYAAAADACALGRRAAPLTELLEVLPRRALSNLQNLRKGTGDGWYPRYWVNMWVIWIGMWYLYSIFQDISQRLAGMMNRWYHGLTGLTQYGIYIYLSMWEYPLNHWYLVGQYVRYMVCGTSIYGIWWEYDGMISGYVMVSHFEWYG